MKRLTSTTRHNEPTRRHNIYKETHKTEIYLKRQLRKGATQPQEDTKSVERDTQPLQKHKLLQRHKTTLILYANGPINSYAAAVKNIYLHLTFHTTSHTKTTFRSLEVCTNTRSRSSTSTRSAVAPWWIWALTQATWERITNGLILSRGSTGRSPKIFNHLRLMAVQVSEKPLYLWN